jgi:hypothetical protein
MLPSGQGRIQFSRQAGCIWRSIVLRDIPPLPHPLLHLMEERVFYRGYLGGSVNVRSAKHAASKLETEC